MNELAEEGSRSSSTSRQSSNNHGKDPPALSADDMQLLKGVGEDVIKMLAENKIDTNVFSSPDDSEAPVQLKQNEQNVKNKAREVRFNAHIQK